MTNTKIAEAFARGEKEGRSGTMFIEMAGNYPVIYSYGHHFPIAVLGVTGKIAYLNTDKYSNTTGRHKGHVRRALQSLGILIEETTTEKLIKIILEKKCLA